MPSSGSFPSLPVPAGTSMPTIEVASGGSLPNDLVLGNVYVDGATGDLYIFLQLDPALTNNAFANNEPATLKANWVATNDVSDGVESGTYPVCCGVARGAYAESTASGTTRYAFFQIWGRGTIANEGTDYNAGEIMILATGTDGAAIRSVGTTTSADGVLTNSRVGTAAATGTGTTTDCFIKVGLCF